MYNHYLPEKAPPDPQTQKHPNGFDRSGAKESFHSSGNRLHLDADTIIALAVIWFLLSDGSVVQTDILIIVAVLFLLGL